jgi:thiol-disulfide isomerase/thioredoxin
MVVSWVSIVAVGCESRNVGVGEKVQDSIAAPSDGDKLTEEVAVEVASWDEIQAMIGEYTTAGNVVVLDIWGIHCPPCIEELPGLAELQRSHGSNGLVCLTLNCSYFGSGTPEDEIEPARKILQRQGITCRSFTNREKDEDLYAAAGIASVPVVQVYDRSGNLAKQFQDEEAKYATNIGPYVAELLKTP